jgi:hypothetical protein
MTTATIAGGGGFSDTGATHVRTWRYLDDGSRFTVYVPRARWYA